MNNIPNYISASQINTWLRGKEFYAAHYCYGIPDGIESKAMIEGKAFHELLLQDKRDESYYKLLTTKGLSTVSADKVETINELCRKYAYLFGKGTYENEVIADYGGIQLKGYTDFEGIFNDEKAIVEVKYTSKMNKWTPEYALSQVQQEFYPLMRELNDQATVPFYYYIAGWRMENYELIPSYPIIYRYVARPENRGWILTAITDIGKFKKSDEWKIMDMRTIEDSLEHASIYDYLYFQKSKSNIIYL